MTGRVFIDTNVLVYAVDRSEPDRRAQAKVVLDAVGETESGVLSAQVLAEFISAARKIPAPLSSSEAELIVAKALVTFALVSLDAAVVREALRCWRRYSLSYWDAQIWAAARIGGVDVIVSEDCPMPELEGIRYVDPFAGGFDLANLSLSGAL